MYHFFFRIHYSSRRRAGHHHIQRQRSEHIILTNEIPRRLEYRQNGEHNEAQYGVRNGTQNGGDSVDECCQISLGMILNLEISRNNSRGQLIFLMFYIYSHFMR